MSQILKKTTKPPANLPPPPHTPNQHGSTTPTPSPKKTYASYRESAAASGHTDVRSPPSEWMNSDSDDESDTYSESSSFPQLEGFQVTPSAPAPPQHPERRKTHETHHTPPYRSQGPNLLPRRARRCRLRSPKKNVAELRADLENRNNNVGRPLKKISPH